MRGTAALALGSGCWLPGLLHVGIVMDDERVLHSPLMLHWVVACAAGPRVQDVCSSIRIALLVLSRSHGASRLRHSV